MAFPETPPRGLSDPTVLWAVAARIYEQCADRFTRDGGVTEWFAQRHGLTTYHELVLYCWLKHHAPGDGG